MPALEGSRLATEFDRLAARMIGQEVEPERAPATADWLASLGLFARKALD